MEFREEENHENRRVIIKEIKTRGSRVMTI
jgi:hypothetical protein